MSNPGITDSVDRTSLTRFDMIIDVRSPAEFAEDRVPGAVNLPVLDNTERAIIGTTYVQESRFLARRMGAALVARNVARHLETALKDASPTFRPLIYCWRGGQRSNAMALILAQVGWRTTVLQGGYKTYRRNVQRRLYDEPLGLGLILLDGNTGCGKTEILKRAAARGAQALDLEAAIRLLDRGGPWRLTGSGAALIDPDGAKLTALSAAALAELTAILTPDDHPPRPLYLRAPDATPPTRLPGQARPVAPLSGA
jgi:rhodanese-related sulfurtransferase